MSSIFTQIIDGEIPGRFIHQDDVCAAFLDISPQTPGHTLVVPRQEVDQWTDLDPETAAHLFTVAQRIGAAQRKAFGSKRAGVVIAGFDVPHTHIHVFPTNSMEDHKSVPFSPAPDEELDAAQQKLLEALEG